MNLQDYHLAEETTTHDGACPWCGELILVFPGEETADQILEECQNCGKPVYITLELHYYVSKAILKEQPHE